MVEQGEKILIVDGALPLALVDPGAVGLVGIVPVGIGRVRTDEAGQADPGRQLGLYSQQRPDFLVKPVLTPIQPSYRLSSLLWLETVDLDVSLPEDSLPVAGGDADRVGLQVLPKQLSLFKGKSDRLERKIYLPGFLYSPVEAGQVVGRIDYLLDGQTVAAADILAADQVSPQPADPAAQREEVLYWLRRLIGLTVW